MSTDFVEFINSKDVKEYVRKTGYQLSPQEAAFVVWQCKNATLEERLAAWEEIINTMPDSSFEGYADFDFKAWELGPAPVCSLHDFLGQYIRRQKELLADFTREGDGTYTIERREGPWEDGRENDHWFFNNDRYSRYKDVLQELHKDDPCFDRMRVFKTTSRVYQHRKESPMSYTLALDYDMEARPLRFVYSNSRRSLIEQQDTLEKLFSKLEVHIPSPFRRGDILWDPSTEPGIPYSEYSVPFVLDYIPRWSREEQEANGFVPGEKFYQRKGEREKYVDHMHTPPRDNGAYGISVDEDWRIWQAYNGFACYLDLEYYPKPLEERFAALKPVSEYIKGNLSEDLLLNSTLVLLHRPVKAPPLYLSMSATATPQPEQEEK